MPSATADGFHVDSERYEDFDHAEVHVAVAHDGCNVDPGEHDGERAEVPVEIQQPRWTRTLPECTGGQRETPQDGCAHERPRHQPARPCGVPQQRRVHQLPPLVVTATPLEPAVTACGTVVVVDEVDAVVLVVFVVLAVVVVATAAPLSWSRAA